MREETYNCARDARRGPRAHVRPSPPRAPRRASSRSPISHTHDPPLPRQTPSPPRWAPSSTCRSCGARSSRTRRAPAPRALAGVPPAADDPPRVAAEPPDKARNLGYKAKQGYVIYRVRVRRGSRKKQLSATKNSKGANFGKPRNCGINQHKWRRNCRSKAEERVGRAVGGLRVLNSYWVAQDSVYKFFEVILVDPHHKVIRTDPCINWLCNPVHKHREPAASPPPAARAASRRATTGQQAAPSRRATWKKQNTPRSWRRWSTRCEF